VTASLFMAVSVLLVAAALQRQGRPAGGARRMGEGAAQGGLQGLGLAALGGGDAGAWRRSCVRIGEGRRWTGGRSSGGTAGPGCRRLEGRGTSWSRTSRRSCGGGRRAAHRKGTSRAQRWRQHLFVDVKEKGEQKREGNLGPATWAAGTRCRG
jgi:hypothetical protein